MAGATSTHDGLNERQRRAVEHRAGPLAVLAGPGTGKTRVIVHRVARLVREDGVDPESILAVTYTVRAAEELRSRLAGLIGPTQADRVRAGTIHGFGRMLVHRFRDVLRMSKEPDLADTAQQKRLMREIIAAGAIHDALAARGWGWVIGDVLEFISRLKDYALTPQAFSRRLASRREELNSGRLTLDETASAAEQARLDELDQYATLYERFDSLCRQRAQVTYDDYMLRAIELLSTSRAAATIVRGEIRHVVVDEFQDVNLATIELLRMVAPPRDGGGPDLCVVGDDDQSIYMFRGADDRAFQRFAGTWPDHALVTLDENYRSTACIVEAANRIIAGSSQRFAPEKVVISLAKDETGDAAPVECAALPGDEHDGPAIAAMLLAERAAHRDRAWSNYAVIARTHTDLERVAGALDIEGIPLVRARAPSPLDDDAVKDLFAWMDVLLNPTEPALAARLLVRPPASVQGHVIGHHMRAYRQEVFRSSVSQHAHPEAFVPWLAARVPEHAGVARLAEWYREFSDAALHVAADHLLFSIVSRTGMAHAELLPARERAVRITKLVQVLRFARTRMDRLDPPGDLRAFRAYYDDLESEDQKRFEGEADRVDSESEARFGDEDAVRLITAHSAKGLEFHTVFVPRVSPGHGYPKTSGDTLDIVPEWLVDRAGDTRTTKQRRLDEERRLFYVACTRAERRLVLLTKKTKTPSKSTNFAQELMNGPPEPDGPIIVARDAHGEDGGFEADDVAVVSAGLVAGSALAEQTSRLKRTARAAAAAAIERAEDPTANPARIESIETDIRRASLHLMLAAYVERHRALPPWIEDHAESLREPAEAMRRALAGLAQEGPGLFRPLPPPLSLSYTQVDAYRRCPRCYYLKYVLDLPDPENEALNLGNAVHESLRRFYEAWRDADAEGCTKPGLQELEAIGREVMLASAKAGEPNAAFLEQCLAQLRLVYKHLHDENAHILHLEQPVRVPFSIGDHTHTLNVRLDRVDLFGEGYRIIDYKTGYPSKEKLEPSKTDLQLGIYALALPVLLGDGETPIGVAEYWLSQTGERGTIALESLNLKKVRETIQEVIIGMLSGAWKREMKCKGPCTLLGPD